MANEIGELNLDYVECGKLFFFQQNTSDFVLLDTSDRDLGSLVNREIYQPGFANYAARNNLRFSNKPNEYGNFSVVLQPSKYFTDDLLFIQVQQRTELDYLYRQPNVKPRTDLPNRPYSQAHISIVPKRILFTYLKNDIGLYDALLCRRSDQFALKDYGIVDSNGREAFPQVLARPIYPKPFVLQSQDLPIVKGLVNTLYDIYMNQDASRNNFSNLHGNVVIVASGLAMERRLAIMQAVQKQLLPIYGILTFALDYAIPPESQLYFCEYLPDEAFPLGKPIVLTIDKILTASDNPKGYYQTATNEGLSRLHDPLVMAFIQKRLTVHDALIIADFLKSETVSNDQIIFSAILRNLRSLESEHKEKLVRILTKTPHQLISFVEQIPKYNLTKEERLGLHQLALVEPLRKLPEGLDLFIDVYLLIRKQGDDFLQFRPYLQKVMTAQESFILTRIKKGEQTELISELLELCYKQSIKLSDGNNYLRGVFSQPTEALFRAIMSFKENGKWNDLFQQELAYALANVETKWTEGDVQRLFESTAVKINELKRLQLIYFLDSDNKIAEFSNLPDAFKAETLSKKIKSALGQQQDVFLIINKNQHEKVRKVALSACNTASLENFKFTRDWLGQIGRTNALGEKTFWQDFETICKNCRESQPLDLKTQEDIALYDLLKRRINLGSGSIGDVCTAINIRNRYNVILAGMLTMKQGIPIKDIKWIIDNIPGTNLLAVETIRLVKDSPKFMESFVALDETYCKKWLDVTIQNKIRNVYIENNAKDLLHETLFEINSASKEFLLELLTKEPGMKVAVTNWSSYTLKVQRLINGRLESHIIRNFLDIVRDTQSIEFDLWEYVKNIGTVVELLDRNYESGDLPELSILSDLMETTDSLPEKSKFTESFTKVLSRIADKSSPAGLVKKYHPLLLYCCSDFLSIHSAQINKTNNFYRASEEVFFDGLASVV